MGITKGHSAARKTIQTFNLGFWSMRNPNMIFISQQNEYFAITICIFSHFAIVLTMTNKIAEFSQYT